MVWVWRFLDTCFGKLIENLRKTRKQEVRGMKGYFVADGYMGYVNGSYLLFADESDYREFLEEE